MVILHLKHLKIGHFWRQHRDLIVVEAQISKADNGELQRELARGMTPEPDEAWQHCGNGRERIRLEQQFFELNQFLERLGKRLNAVASNGQNLKSVTQNTHASAIPASSTPRRQGGKMP
jgi:hypothetical protein